MSIIKELQYKMFRSGSRLLLFIGINVLVFLIVNLLAIPEFLFTRTTSASDWLQEQLSIPAYLPALAFKPWTILTYMFSHKGLFHIFFNMLWLYWMGRLFEEYLNKRQFTFTYFAGGLAGALLFILFYNTFPAFSANVQSASLIGASASVMGIVVATATLLPDYTIQLLLFGSVRLKYLAIVYVLLDIISIAGANAGGSIAHLGGAVLGYFYIVQLRKGNDWSKIFMPKTRLKPISNESGKTNSNTSRFPDQNAIDLILDKISKSGYESLTKEEKQKLFNASKK
ncbi:MAG TPA: rhomboid family intramembrane serine protease [Sphingobacteriaceae bacterium]|nr:rhomboid family intramembrane serine protease [Sphingobacteriaceae bacterium]